MMTRRRFKRVLIMEGVKGGLCALALALLIIALKYGTPAIEAMLK